MADPYFSSVVLLVHCDGANGSTTFTDTSPSAHTLLRSGATAVSTAQVKFGTGAAAIAASVGAIYASAGLGDFNFLSSPFTIELWAYASSTPGVSSLFSQFTNAAGGGWFFGAVSGNLAFWYYDGTGTRVTFASTTALATGGWHFYTVDRDAGGTLRIYIDGVVVASTSAPTFQSAAQQVNIGNSNRVTDYWPGYIDEVRVTKGVARYGGAFTPPTAPFDDTGVVAATPQQYAVSVIS